MIPSIMHRAGPATHAVPTNPRLQLRWLAKRSIQALDRMLRRCHGVHEYTDDPECMIRIAWRTARHDILLRDGTIVRSGDAIVELHLWNQQLPPIPPPGPGIAWGAAADRQVRRSLTLL